MMFLRQQPTFLQACPSYHVHRPHVYVYKVNNNNAAANATTAQASKTSSKAKDATVDHEVVHSAPQVKSDASQSPSVTYLNRSARIIEEKDFYVLEMDLPGVKSHDVNIEVDDQVLRVSAERKSPQVSTMRQQFAIDSKLVDISKLQASMEDGVLSIRVPKKEEMKPFEIEIQLSEAPEIEDPTEAAKTIRFMIDVPGIKKEDMKLDFRDGMLNIDGERKKGGVTVSKIKRSYTIDSRKADVHKIQSYLSDGELTIVIPLKEPQPLEKLYVQVGSQPEPAKVIHPVAAEEDVVVAVPEKKSDNTSRNDESSDVTVETVIDEADGKKSEWEKVE